MKNNPLRQNKIFILLAALGLLILFVVPRANAVSGTWTSDAAGNWSDTSKWASAFVADGTGNTADFSTVNLTADRTVTLDAGHTISTLNFGDASPDFNWTLSGANTLTLGTTPFINVVNQTATISSVIAGTTGLTKTGAGTLTLSAANTYSGNTTVSAGIAKLDFTAAGAPAANIINAASALKLGGGSVQILGAIGGSAQTFASTAISATTSGQSGISAAPVSGTIPTVSLGVLTGLAGGMVRIDGAAYNSGASSGTTLGGTTVAATATYNVTANTIEGGLLSYSTSGGAAGAYATVNLYDWAGVSGGTVGTAQAGTLVGVSQIGSFYTTGNTLSGTGSFGLNIDLTASATIFNNANVSGAYGTVRFNAASAMTLTAGRALGGSVVGGFLVTPNVGANNITLAPNTGQSQLVIQCSRSTFAATGLTIWQNNTSGELIISATYNNGSNTGATSSYSQGGLGSVFLNAANGYTGQNFLNGGYTVISANSGLGAIATGAAVNMNGGTLFGNATLTLDNAGAAPNRGIFLSGAGGALAASAGNTLTANGFISGAGRLIIGIPASSANGNTIGLLPGSGSGTANVTPVYATGTVVLNSGGNGFSGGTVLYSGTANINSIWALGGAVYGGLTFAGGTLQYAAAPLNSALDITHDTSTDGTNGATKSVTFTGNAIIDLNGNSVTYANPVGNFGGGSLTVKSTAANGMLTLQGANTYTGDTTVASGTLKVAATGSILSPNITVASGATLDLSALTFTLASGRALLGGGTVTGSVTTVASAKIIPGSIGIVGTLSFSNNLALVGGTTNYFDLSSTPAGSNDKIAVAGALNLTGVSRIAVNFTATPGAGRYRLITYASKTGTAAANLAFSLSGFSIGTLTAALDDSQGAIDLVLSSAHVPVSLTWLGDAALNNWNTATVNWTNLGNATASVFSDFDFVTFDDIGSTTPAVNLTTSLNPASITVNSVNDYTFSGPGSISFGNLIKSNINILTLLTTNTLPGPILVRGGTLQVGDGVTSGTIGTGSVSNDATLVFNSPATITTGPINGTGNVAVKVGMLIVGGNSTLNALTLGSSGVAATLDLAGSRAVVTAMSLDPAATSGTIGNSSTSINSELTYNGGTSSYAGVIQNVIGGGNRNVSLLVSSGSLTLNNNASPYTGGTVVGGGTLLIGSNGTGQVGTGSVTITNGATLVMYRGNTTDNADSAIAFNNALVVPSGQTATIWASPRSRTGSSGTAATFTSALSGSGTLNLRVNATAGYFGGNWNAFSGQVNVTPRTASDDFPFAIGGVTDNSFANLKLNLATGVNMYQSVNPPTGTGTQTLHNIGELSGSISSSLGGNPVAGRFVNWSVGALNTSSTFAGNIVDNTGATRFTKVGSGNLTLSGYNTHSGNTWVNSGTLTVLGTFTVSPVTNYSGATLAGTGLLGGAVDMEVGSTLSPGVNDYGTLTCSGDLFFNGGTNVVDISTTNTDYIVVGGQVGIASGAVRLVVHEPLTNGTYKLIGFNLTLSGSVASMSLSGFSQPGQTARLSDAIVGEIDLVVEPIGAANLTWTTVGVAQDNLWNVASSINWTNGSSLVSFHTGDRVTFNDSGAANSPVDLRAVVEPASILVTGTSAYVFSATTGAGRIYGTSNTLTVTGTGSLTLDMTNSIGGATTIGVGSTLNVGTGNSASLGSGSVSNNGALVFNQTNTVSLADISGSGSLTKNGGSTLTLAGGYAYAGSTTIGAGATLQAGTNGVTGPLLGAVVANGTLIMNQSGNLTNAGGISGSGTFIKNGSSVFTLAGANTYLGNTYINSGTLKLGASQVVPDAGTAPGSIGWFILDGGATTAGTFDLNGFNETVNLLIGASGTVPSRITNSASSGTNTLTFGNDFGSPSTTFAGVITEDAAGAKIALVKQGASTNVLTAANTYSGGTIIKGGTLTLANGSALGSAGISLSNSATLGIASDTGGNSIFVGNGILTGPGAMATITSSFLSSTINGLFTSGDGNSTNVITGNVSIASSATKQFQSFTGTVVVAAGSQLRFSSSTLSVNGGDNATFIIEGYINTRNGTGNAANSGVSLGALAGSGILNGAGNAAGNSVYTIGAKGIDSTFTGVIQDTANGNVSIVKVGAAKLTLSGTVTNTGSMTINGGTLALVEPVSLDNSATLKLGAATATIDASARADGNLNLGIVKAQALSGIGNVTGNLAVAANSSVSVGLGNLTVTGTATLNGPVTLQLNRTNVTTHSEIIAAGIAVSSSLTVQNIGPALQGGDTFQLFSTAVSGFTATNLPALTGALYWTNKLALNGSIAVINPINTNRPPLLSSFNGTTLTLSWPTNSGWTLQMQANSLSVGVSNNWVDVPGSTTITTTNIVVNPALPTVFYRLKY